MPKGERLTSQEAYQNVILDGRKIRLRDAILQWLIQYDRPEGFTRNEISEYMGKKIPGVCSSIHTLLVSNLAVEVGVREDAFTHEKANAIRAKECFDGQGSLF